MTPIEIFKLFGMILGIITFISGLIVKFTTQGNKISYLEKEVADIKDNMETLEEKIDDLRTEVSSVKSDIRSLTESVNAFGKLLEKQGAILDSIRIDVAKHQMCNYFPGKA